ncbi:MAG: peptidase M61 [Burkholderiaceae bacterium]|jgi:predicted metalloprotease with PDZ domain|nr:peptidase M61 [Burkholderiaceae bacterium]
MGDLHGHRYAVEMVIGAPEAAQRVSLPVWIPGSYLVREFSRHLSPLTARQGRKALAVMQIDKCTWEIACDPAQRLTLAYEVYAFDDSVRAAWLDTQRGFFNATSLLLRAHGRENAPHRLTVPRPSQPECRIKGREWQLATALEPLKTAACGFGTYCAADYDELADHPVELGAFWSGAFTAGGVQHRFVVAGAPETFDGARLLADAQAICAAAIRFWPGKAPFQRYLFLLNAVQDGYGGLEHCASTALICAWRNLPRLPQPGDDGAKPGKPDDDYTTLLGLVSHEYFHAWNVKRLKPAEFARYDYACENYTRLLWFFEGFTSYYDDLLLLRAGRIDQAAYLGLLAKTINQIAQAPGRRVQSLAQASFDAWVRHYRSDENTPNSTVSYYCKGALAALCFDLTLRAEGRATLDDVMCALWQRCKGGAMREADFAGALTRLGGRLFDREMADWIHGTGELPVIDLLRQAGIAVQRDPAPLAQRLGLRVREGTDGIVIKTVLDGGPAARAGMAAGDEWLGVESPAAGCDRGTGPAAGWRLRRLDELLVNVGLDKPVTALVARGGRLLRLPLPPAGDGAGGVWRLSPRETTKPVDTQPGSRLLMQWPAR